ncbi:cytochrome c oxidase subunit II [Neoehrlichia mikurensis]|uniref:Cytochrome c oxidase subunit 2 n=1 Tax=Neoehrlichia mikurensis TaxID=89586 RepID=A0A9Q9C1D5_9RICK|nr:cytochrome c oxidase subunit II [Neoehrlichia mikurensis]QXK91671.1 cytochrome c oxidase subunit II [Neoehrlichia mikurensis]QXK92882.1 cytochrome c oxidase subunit II [Neoehrlichia mikurensis]QXK93362.1 cytochrome c oxidase subunit II [Neoehrlichia mikurensis]UTO55694.1 cytochrome c oxidase subunit II [Neoehrlichia mikurensis]UTO56611.1 cytochrome c oxidase subunit II [Neoehrlichia mikurensis]
MLIIYPCLLFIFNTVCYYCNLYAASTAYPWQMGFQDPATDTMEHIIHSHNFVMIIMLIIAAVVFSMLTYIIIRFRKKDNDQITFNTKNSHNALLEIIWTVIPLMLVGFLTISNVKLIQQEQKIPKTELTIKAIGYQWYWSYIYPDYNIQFDSYMKASNDLKEGELRLLEVDNKVIVPTNVNVLVQVTGADVIHSWAVPALGVKIDAVPGRLNETWFNIKNPGVYYGQCSELCGRLHGFMPITIVAVSKEEFAKWVKEHKL